MSCLIFPTQASQTKLAAIDWAMLETAIALGAIPDAACELIRYRQDAIEPEIPEHVVDLGLRGSPNLELLEQLAPDLILTSPFYAAIRDRLTNISDVFEHTFYLSGQSPWQNSLDALDSLGQKLGLPTAAEKARLRSLKELKLIAEDLLPFRDRPYYLIQIGDARHFRAFGYDSMFGSVLSELQLQNAWTGRSAFSFSAPVPLERLADEPEARIVIIAGVPIVAKRSLNTSVLWRELEPVAKGRVHTLENINPFGGVLAGLRFARLLRNLLLEARP